MASEKGLASGYDRQDLEPNPGLSHKARKHERICFAEILTGLSSGQVKPQRGHTSKYAGNTKVRFLQRYDSDGQG